MHYLLIRRAWYLQRSSLCMRTGTWGIMMLHSPFPDTGGFTPHCPSGSSAGGGEGRASKGKGTTLLPQQHDTGWRRCSFCHQHHRLTITAWDWCSSVNLTSAGDNLFIYLFICCIKTSWSSQESIKLRQNNKEGWQVVETLSMSVCALRVSFP